jgi:hemolysin-activating ACP:hemolysin acyltransferase
MNSDQENALAEILQCKLNAKADIPWQKLNQIMYCVKLNQFQLFVDETCHQVIGYVCWANVSRATIRRVTKHSIFPKYFYEWTEGENILIIDACINRNVFFYVRDRLKLARTLRLSVAYQGKRRFRFFQFDRVTD